MSTFGGVAAHAVSTFRDPAIYDARQFDAADVQPSGASVTPLRRRRRHGWGIPRHLAHLHPVPLDPTTGGLR